MGPGGEGRMLASTAWKSLKFHKVKTEHLFPRLSPELKSAKGKHYLF